MWKTSLIILFSISLVGLAIPDKRDLDKGEARKAFEYLNQIRKQPITHCQRLKFSPVQVVPRPALIWNDTLALVAERKAVDMATRNYVAHVDPTGYGINYYIDQSGYILDPWWLREPRENNFESLQAGAENGEQAIDDLIMDIGVPAKGHRTHLLGIGEWNASLVDVGIGYYKSDRSTKYQSYTCVIIAKHK